MIWKKVRGLSAFLLLPLLIACGSGGSSEGSSSSGYKDTKSMVLDILKSDDGKKAIKDAAKTGDETATGMLQAQSAKSGGGKIQMLSTEDAQQLQLVVKDVLTADGSDKMLKAMMTDPKFAGDFAKALQKENKQLQKDLMKDPEYQKQMLDLMKNPDYEKLMIDNMKSAQYRQQVMTIMQEALQSPLYRLELMTLLKKVMEEEAQPKSGQGKGKKQGEKKSEQKQDGGGEGQSS
ncbi:spore gernimation protein [Paenibacillus hemerocallicola]|uniref:Spore gernimation protein n=1 Tax=Paenibacillus hemerocallicola TaxID=1172614 RepID=A0A5C4T0A9_9BACL|nr:spore germination lipoprotein GerD [Paenibacillus hemerocallicola]TNJ62215.1 spore gernimation protein [Paenibacillus hemerocallicola]